MSNQLKMAHINAIRTLLERGWSQRRVSRELGINRSTVARYVRIFAEEDSKPAISTPGVCGRKSTCQEFSQEITQKLDLGLSAKRIHQDLVEEQVTVGTPVARRPRTDLSERHYRTGLLSWVLTSNRTVGQG